MGITEKDIDEATALSDGAMDRFATRKVLELVRDDNVVGLGQLSLNLLRQIRLLNELLAIEQKEANGGGEARA